MLSHIFGVRPRRLGSNPASASADHAPGDEPQTSELTGLFVAKPESASVTKGLHTDAARHGVRAPSCTTETGCRCLQGRT